MGDLYFDDIEDQGTWSDQTILRDIRAMVKAGQREGPMLDYKAEIPEKDNWPETVAAFANSFGGLIIFGVEAKDDHPRRLIGFEPKGVEVKTKLANMLLSRIRPRPDFAIRVVTFDEDQSREVAILRVSEGQTPPYMHSKGDEHRIYVRVTARKAEADYLQLASLLEKRRRSESQAVESPSELFDSSSQLLVMKPPGSNLVSSEFYRFVLSPRNITVGPRLNFETERQFRHCINDVLGTPLGPAIRTRDVTIFPKGAGPYLEQRFGVAARGGLGFVSYPCIQTNDGLFFVPIDFCRTLLDFLSVSSLFYERTIRFYGSCLLNVNLLIPEAKLFPGFPAPNAHLPGANLFHPPLSDIRVNAGTQIEVALHPMGADRLQDYLEAVLIAVARTCGSVLDPKFRAGMQVLVEDAVRRLASARSAET